MLLREVSGELPNSTPTGALPNTGDEIGQTTPVPFAALFRFAASKDRWLMAIGVAGALLQSATVPLLALYIQVLFRSIFIPNDDGTLPPQIGPHSLRDHEVNQACSAMVLLGMGTFIASELQNVCFSRAADNQVFALQRDCFAKVLAKDIEWHDAQTAGELATVLSKCSADVKEGIGQPLGEVVRKLCTTALAFGVAFWMDWRMTLAMCASLPFLGAAVVCLIVVYTRYSMLIQERSALAGGRAEAALAAIRTVAAYGGHTREVQSYDALLAGAESLGKRMGFAAGCSMGSVLAIIYGTIGLGFFVGAGLVTRGYEQGCWKHEPQPFGTCFTGTTMMAILQTVINGGLALASIGPSLASFAMARAAAAKLFCLAANSIASGQGIKLPQWTGAFEFVNVEFAYPSRPSIRVLSNLSLKVPAGTTMAVIGVSGSGKSTLVQLFERFYTPSKGSITLDGHDIQDLDLGWLRGRISLVQQEPVLFSETISYNILQGQLGATAHEVVDAARVANAHEFIASFPEGYDTVLGDRGMQLSGGQKQRIAIARAMIRNPVVLLLDEATSALDTESEHVVQEALDALWHRRNMTTLVIAHRLSTVQKADQICVLGKGCVQDQGTHAELLSRPGLYADLVQLQSKGLAENDALILRESDVNVTSGSLSCGGDLFHGTRAQTWAGVPAARRRDFSSTLPSTSAARVRRLRNRWSIPDGVRATRNALSDKSLSFTFGLPTHGTLLMHLARDARDEVERNTFEPIVTSDTTDIAIPVFRLWRLNRKDRAWILVGLLCTALSSLSMSVLGMIYASAANVLTAPPASWDHATGKWQPIFDSAKIRSDALTHSIQFVAIGAALLPIVAFQMFGLRRATESLNRQLQTLTFEAMLRQDMAWFDTQNVGLLVERLASDVPLMKAFTFEAVQSLAQTGLSFIGGFLFAFLSSWRLTLCAIGLIPCVAFGHILASRGNAKRHENRSAVVTAEALNNIRTVAAFGLEEEISHKFTSRLVEERTQDRRIYMAMNLAVAFGAGMPFLIYAALIYLSSQFINAGRMRPDGAMAVIFPIIFSSQGLGQAQQWFSQKAKARGACNRIFGILDRRPSVDAFQAGVEMADALGRVEFRHVSFYYPTRRSVPIFRSLNLTIEAGTTAAFVGPSGCGKSTTVALLQRFYDPCGGAVLLAGRDVREFNLPWLRAQMALIQQEPVLFQCSIADNIAYGRDGVSQEEIVSAAKVANAHDFIVSFPDGYATDVGAHGVQLSGGQKQRIAIARGMIREPSLLLLDEATSALDLECERVVQASLDQLIQVKISMTTIVIAHRLATIRNVDCIYVFAQGAIVESGSHKELVELRGVYSALTTGNRNPLKR